MKTITNSVFAVAAVVGAAGFAQAAGPVDFGVSPALYGRTTNYGAAADYATNHAATYNRYDHSNLMADRCLTGECGHPECANGVCDFGRTTAQNGGVSRPLSGQANSWTASPYSVARPVQPVNYHYGTTGCAEGICSDPRPHSHATNYPSYGTGTSQQILPGGCIGGTCANPVTMPAPHYTNSYSNSRPSLFRLIGLSR